MRLLRPPVCAMVVAIIFCAAAVLPPTREAQAPPRETFALFPMRIADWTGQTERFSSEIEDALKVEDYILANFSASTAPEGVNLYVAYYKTQQLGSAAHSPRTCIPGDGWEIEDLSRTTLATAQGPLVVNRAIISKGQTRQLVYYWFAQRGRLLASEYQVKWYLFVDALSRNRTDGALVRLITPIVGSDVASAEDRLYRFLLATTPRLRSFLPS